jgi:hypothetical protein
MSVRSALFKTPSLAVSRPRLLIGAAGLACLAALVLAHAVVLTAILGDAMGGQRRAIVIGLLWLVSAVALVLIARGLRHIASAWAHAKSGAR